MDSLKREFPARVVDYWTWNALEATFVLVATAVQLHSKDMGGFADGQ